MVTSDRRNFLRQSAALAGGSSVLLTGTIQTENETNTPSTNSQKPLPPRRRQYADEPWTSHRGGPGNAAAVSEGPGFSGPPDVVWEAENESKEIAIADGLIFTRIGGVVRALDTETGERVWESEDIGAGGIPSAAYKSIYVGGDQITRLNSATGQVIWESDLNGDCSFHTPTVAYDMVYTIADGDLYGLNAHNGRVRWKADIDIKPIPRGHDIPPRDIQSIIETPVAAHHGLVYTTGSESESGNKGPVLALDAMTGEIEWTSYYEFGFHSGLTATEDLFAVANRSHEIRLYDPNYETYHRRRSESYFTGFDDPAINDDGFYAAIYEFGYSFSGKYFYEIPSLPTLTQDQAYGHGRTRGADEPALFAWSLSDDQEIWRAHTDTGRPRIALDNNTIYLCGQTLKALRK